MTLRLWLCGLLIAATVLGASAARATMTPFAAQGECEHWQGEVHETDVSHTIVLQLCPTGKDQVKGDARYDSQEAGSSIRALEGRWASPRLTLHDTSFVEQHPKGTWSFCLVDSYDLTLISQDELTGNVVSSACGDYHTKIHLRRVPTDGASGAASAGAGAAASSPSGPPSPASSSTTHPAPGSGSAAPPSSAPSAPQAPAADHGLGCGCRLSGSKRAGHAWPWLGLASLAAAGRRARRRRAAPGSALRSA